MDSIGKTIKKPESLLFITAVFGSILYISLIFNDNLWVDEAFTASLIRGSLGDVVRDTVHDTLPPFYNLLGKLLTTLFGYSSTILKFSSCIPLILLIFFGGKRVYDVFGFYTAFLFQLFLFTEPYFLYYAVEIRMYSFGMFSCGMAGACFAALLSDPVPDKKQLRGFVLYTVFSGYIHHYALVSCGMMWLILLILLIVRKDRDGLRVFIKSLACFLILYLPGLILTVYQVKNASSYFTMAPLSLKSFLGDLRYPFVTNITPLSALLLLSVLAAAALGILTVKRSFTGLCLLSILYLTLLFGYLTSLLAGRSIFTARYLIPSLPVLWMGCAVLIGRLADETGKTRLLLYLFLLVTACTGVFGYLKTFREEYRPGVEEMKAYFNNNTGSDDACLFSEDPPEIEICFRYYFPYLKKTKWKNAAETKGKLFLIQPDGEEPPLERCRKYGYNPIYIGDYSFDRYSFSLYELEGN